MTDANGTEIPLDDWDAVVADLREFADGGARTLVVDHDGGSITVVGDRTEYAFRRP